MTHGGIDVVGFFGHGANRRLAMAAGAPAIPGGYVVYVEVPLPAGTTFRSGLPGLQYALYDGRTESSPLLFATTKSLPFTGQPVRQLVDLNDLDGTTPPKSGDGVLLFVVSSTGPTIGKLADTVARDPGSDRHSGRAAGCFRPGGHLAP